MVFQHYKTNQMQSYTTLNDNNSNKMLSLTIHYKQVNNCGSLKGKNIHHGGVEIVCFKGATKRLK